MLLAILAIVTATTGATLFIVQAANSELHALAVDQIFTAQVESFRARQQEPLDAATKEAKALAESVRLFAALEEGESEIIYATAVDELRGANFAFFRFTDAAGSLIPPPEGEAQGPPGIDEAIRAQIGPAARAGVGIRENESVQLGFLLHEGVVYHIVSSAIAIPQKAAGSLLIGQLVPSPPAASEGNALFSGLLVDGRIVSQTIPAALLPSLAENLAATGMEDGPVLLDSRPYRIDRHPLNPGSVFSHAYLVSLYSLTEFRQRQRDLTIRIVGIGAAGLVAASVAATIFAGRLARPVRDLVEGAESIRRGDFNVRVARRTGDELGTLADSFNEMASGLALKERYRSVLQLVTDPSVADELISGAVQLGGETREVSVVFCDIRGFTALSQGMPPAEVVALLNEHMSALTRVVQEHRGVVDKFVGDEIMILFGAPKSYGDDAARALRCAAEMIRCRREMNETAARPIAIGVGIASGPVLAGCMGSENRLDYTVVGERVNLASRLCGQAGPMEIVIDAATRAAQPAEFAASPAESLNLKGFTGSVAAHRIRPLPA